MPFLMTYWKQLGIVILLSLAILGAYLKGHEAGEAKIQARWDAQKVLDLQAVAKAEAKTEIIETNGNKVTENDNIQLQKTIDTTANYYSSHSVPTNPNRVQSTTRKTSSSEVSSVPTTTEQSNQNTTDTVSRADYEALANDCLATTIQLDNAQQWAKEQVQVNAE